VKSAAFSADEQISKHFLRSHRTAFKDPETYRAYATSGNYSNWELSTDRANAARRFVEAKGLAADQVTQVRGFADRRLRKPTDPLDPSNRRVSLIVQYTVLNDTAADAKATAGGEERPVDSNTPPAPGEKSAKPDAEQKAEEPVKKAEVPSK